MMLFVSCGSNGVCKSTFNGKWVVTNYSEGNPYGSGLKSWLGGKTTILKVDVPNSKFEISQNGNVQISGNLKKFSTAFKEYNFEFILSNGEQTHGIMWIMDADKGFYNKLCFSYVYDKEWSKEFDGQRDKSLFLERVNN